MIMNEWSLSKDTKIDGCCLFKELVRHLAVETNRNQAFNQHSWNQTRFEVGISRIKDWGFDAALNWSWVMKTVDINSRKQPFRMCRCVYHPSPYISHTRVHWFVFVVEWVHISLQAEFHSPTEICMHKLIIYLYYTDMDSSLRSTCSYSRLFWGSLCRSKEKLNYPNKLFYENIVIRKYV
jgi:hypothetical protein